jgi:dihydroorotase-like cyclic amidohydrolase
VPSGFAGVETLLPLMLTAVHDGKLSLERLVHATSEAPAKTWGLWPRKGQVAVGADADLTLIDPKATWTVDPAAFKSKGRCTPYEQMKLTGRAAHVIVGGRVCS